MTSVGVLTGDPSLPDEPLEVLRDSLRHIDRAEWEEVREPGEAEVILFAEHHGEATRDTTRVIPSLAIYRRHAARIVVHCGRDVPRPVLPGLYPSIPAGWAAWLRCEGAPYLVRPNPYLDRVRVQEPPARLAAFTGCCDSKPVRLRLLDAARRWSRDEISVADTFAEFVGSLRAGDLRRHDELKRAFVVDMLGAKFALCPRGWGASSFRIFEAMQLGRAPVIIADDWTPPVGPDWDRCAIRVRQEAIGDLPRILRAEEPTWAERGRAARLAWERFYAPKQIGRVLLERAWEIVGASALRRVGAGLARRVYILGPRQLSILGDRLSGRRHHHRRAGADTGADGPRTRRADS